MGLHLPGALRVRRTVLQVVTRQVACSHGCLPSGPQFQVGDRRASAIRESPHVQTIRIYQVGMFSEPKDFFPLV